jgi:multiple sugar transport system substrate-binding protein
MPHRDTLLQLRIGRRWPLGLLLLLWPWLAGCERAADDRIRLVYWEKWTGAEGEAMQRVVEAFNRSQDRIVVSYLPVSQVDRKAIVAIAGGDPPDILGIWAPNISSFADRSAILPLDAFLAAESGSPDAFMERFYPVYASMVRHDGQVYGLPSTPTTVALHWNKAMFREAGLDPERPPRTLAELDEMARRLERRDPVTGELLALGFLPQEPGWFSWAFPAWFGGSLIEGDVITLGTEEANRRALEWTLSYTERIGVDAIRKFTSGFGSGASPQAAFFSGKIAMVFQGVWLNNFIRQFAPGMDYGVAPWPAAVPGVHDFTVADADVLVIPRGSRHPEAAWEFLRFVSSHNPHARSAAELQGMELLCYLQQKNSPLRDWSPYFAEQHPHPFIAVFRELASSPHAVHPPNIGIWGEFSREWNSLFERVRLALVDPSDGLAYAHRRMVASWDRHRASVERQRAAGGLPAAPGPVGGAAGVLTATAPVAPAAPEAAP